MTRYPKARRRLHRAFLHWLALNHDRFTLPLELLERRDRFIRLGFTGITPALEVGVTTWEINLAALWQDEWWDHLISLEALPCRVAGVYHCHLCMPEAKRLWPNREALWLDHLFNPLLEWVNTELAVAHQLGLYETEGGGVRWAKLLGAVAPEDDAPGHRDTAAAFCNRPYRFINQCPGAAHMSNRLTHAKRTDPSLPDTSGWFQDLHSPQDQTNPPAAARPPTRLAHRARNGLQLAIIALLLALLVMDRLDSLRHLIHWPVLASEPPATENLKAPNEFVKQQYQSLSQTRVAKKQMIKFAQQVIELSNRDIERYTFELSIADMALNKIRSEYAVTGLDE